MRSTIDATRRRAWVGLLRAHARLIDAVEHDLREQGCLPLTWYEVLVKLTAAPGGTVRMQELARTAFLTKSGVTRLVDRMEAEGLVARTTCPSDRRGTLAAITPAGRRAYRETFPVLQRAVEEHFAGPLSDAEAACMASAFDRLAPEDPPSGGASC